MVAKKDYSPRMKHPEVAVMNLYVLKALTSLKSRGYVREQYAWRHFYWCLTNEGIQYLRDFLHLPQEIVPSTLKRPARQETSRPKPRGFGEGDRGARDEMHDRDMYRHAVEEYDKKPVGLGGQDSQVVFRGGYGRGQPEPGGM